MRRSTRKKKKINYNKSDDCNDVTDNNGNSVSMVNNGNNVSPHLTMSLTEFMDGPLCNINASYKSTFTSYVRKTIDGYEDHTANDILSPTKASLFKIDENAKKSDGQQRNLTTAVNNARKCFQKYFKCDPEDTGSPMPKRNVLKQKKTKTEDEILVSKFLEDALNEKFISKEDLNSIIDYFEYRCKHRQNLESKAVAPYKKLEQELVHKIGYQTRDWVLCLQHIQELYLQRIDGDENKKERLTFWMERVEYVIQKVKSRTEQLFAEALEDANRRSMFDEVDDDEEDDDEEP